MILPADLPGLQYVARNMNAMDRAEIFATRHDDDADAVALQALHSRHSYLCVRSNVPICAFGSFEAWPGVWNIWMFSTDLFDLRAGLSVLRQFRRVVVPDMLALGAHRVQCDSIDNHYSAHHFIRRFGGVPEAEMHGYGRNGEDFIRFACDRASLEAQVPKPHTSARPNLQIVGGRGITHPLVDGEAYGRLAIGN